jgi:hypothetical protein
VNISNRYARLLARRAPAEDRIVAKFAAESFEREPGESTKYLLGAMKPVDAQYTARLREQGDRVENQLTARLKPNYQGIEFRRQGSVSNNTHIKYYSDIDVLTIIDKFYTLEHPQEPDFPYTGEPIDDLITLRSQCVRELGTAFPAARVDNTGSTAVSLSGGSLACKVDVVPANWFNTNDYAASGAEHQRGIQVLNKETRERTRNFPFLYNHRIERHDAAHSRVPRMLMRLLKTVRADSIDEGTQIGCSSFDLCSLVYRMPDEYFVVLLNRPLDIVGKLLDWLRVTIELESLRGTLKVVDDSRIIYRDGSTLTGVTQVYRELDSTYQEAKKERHGLALLSEAHIR